MCEIREIVMRSADITPFQRRVYLALLDVPPVRQLPMASWLHVSGVEAPKLWGRRSNATPLLPMSLATG